MLVLDDLHWADQPSLLLLQFLSRQIGDSCLLVVCCYRDMELSRQHPLAEALGELTRTQRFQRVLLRGLSREDTGHCVERTTGVAPPPEILVAVHQQTEGNPLFVTEIARLMALTDESTAEQGGQRESANMRIPEGIREVIGRRLNRMSQDCNEALATAGIIGREFALEQLRLIVESITEGRLLEVLNEALDARIIEELRPQVGRYQFTHALVQETLVDEIPLTGQVQLHARVASALEELYGARVEEHAAELAHHFAQAQTLLGTEKLIHYSFSAGEQALAAYAYEEALRHFQRGLTAKGVPQTGNDPATDGEAAAFLFGLGRAQAATGERRLRPVAVATMRRAFDYYAEAGDVDRAVAVAEDPFFHAGAEGAGASHVLARALRLVPPDSHAAGRLLCNYGRTSYHETADYPAAEEAFDRAIVIARHEGDTALEALALGNASHVDTDELLWKDSLEKALQAIELAAQGNPPQAEIMGQHSAFEALRAMGDFGRARVYADAMLASAERLRISHRLSQALSVIAVAAYQNGDWEAARSFSDHSIEILPQSVQNLACRTRLEYQVGNFSQGESYVERLVQVMTRAAPGPSRYYAFPAPVIAEVSRITGDTHRFEVADEAAGVVLSSPYAIPRYAMGARTGLALMAVQRGDGTAAAEQYAYLKAASGTLRALDVVTVDRILGLLCHTMGDLDKAGEHFEDALTFCRRALYRPELAWTCCDYADTMQQRNAPGDGGKAMSLLDESLAISTELGMRPLMERAQERLDRLVSTAPEPPDYTSGLSQREVEVLRLVALGKSNREIGEELVISEGTARRHVSNIYQKIGVNNRSEATSYALREGLLSTE